MSDEQNEVWWPSTQMQEAISKTIASLLPELDWEDIEPIAAPVYDYIKRLLDEGPLNPLSPSFEDGEIHVGLVVSDENGDVLFDTRPFNLADAVLELYDDDADTMRDFISALEATTNRLRAKLATIQ